MRVLKVILVSLAVFKVCAASHLPTPHALTVDCLSSGTIDFRDRLKYRGNAEDQTTLWLFKGEQLNIDFELKHAAVVDVLDVRYSNDGDWDEVGLALDGEELGKFKTFTNYAWGRLWNVFESSGPVGGGHTLEAGHHTFTLKILYADFYGIEIDYIRFNITGGQMNQMGKKAFMCLHRPIQGAKPSII